MLLPVMNDALTSKVRCNYIESLTFQIMDKESYTSEQEKTNEALAVRYHDDIFQKGKLEVAYEILSWVHIQIYVVSKEESISNASKADHNYQENFNGS
jgi:hypothetical protein